MSKFNRGRSQGRRIQSVPEGVSMTQQHMGPETDINNIVSKYLRTGTLGNPSATRQAIFGDFTAIDYMDMQNAIADIDQQFASLSSKIRRRFNNSAYQLVRFIENPDNRDEAVKLGILEGAMPPSNQLDVFDTDESLKADPEAQPSFKPPEKGL